MTVKGVPEMKPKGNELKFKEFTHTQQVINKLAVVYYVGPKTDKMRVTTCVVVTPEGKVGIGSVVCSPDDSFSLNEGREKSFAHALVSLNEGRELINKQPTYEYLKIIAKEAAGVALDNAVKAKTRHFARVAVRFVKWLNRELSRYPVDPQEVVRLAVLYQNGDKAKLSEYGKL